VGPSSSTGPELVGGRALEALAAELLGGAGERAARGVGGMAAWLPVAGAVASSDAPAGAGAAVGARSGVGAAEGAGTAAGAGTGDEAGIAGGAWAAPGGCVPRVVAGVAAAIGSSALRPTDSPQFGQ
jgi:hypothetical protein